MGGTEFSMSYRILLMSNKNTEIIGEEKVHEEMAFSKVFKL